MHLDLLSIICNNINRQPIAMSALPSRNLEGSIPARADTGSSARESRAFSRNLEAEPDAMADPSAASGNPEIWKLPVIC
jgi:hypothetical protein